MKRFYRDTGKRLLDVGLCLPALVFLLPIMVLTALALLILQGRPALFRQLRPGLKGRPFELLKFRTMSVWRGSEAEAPSDHLRLTFLGRLLRATSLDELPELINVLRGEMSLVGPRPLLTQYLDRYTPEQARRHETRPGITGWAQIHGRNSLDWEKKFRLDVWYVDHCSFWLDLKILALTVPTVLARKGIVPDGRLSTPEFLGSTGGREQTRDLI